MITIGRKAPKGWREVSGQHLGRWCRVMTIEQISATFHVYSNDTGKEEPVTSHNDAVILPLKEPKA
jgi:hypothetical protein